MCLLFSTHNYLQHVATEDADGETEEDMGD